MDLGWSANVEIGVAAGTAATDRRYRAERSADVVRLQDTASNTTVSICTALGNNAFDMRANGVEVLWRPFASLDDFKARGNGRGGIPFLAPWANRLDEPAFYANGRRFPFDMDIGNISGPLPIHGLLMRTERWQIVDLTADDEASSVTSRLEFFRAPLWMKQFPFAHAIEMTHRLLNGVLELRTRIENLSADPMPVAVGFHPYFRLSDCPRDEWTVAIGARTRWLLSDAKLPTGDTEPIDRTFEYPRAVTLKDQDLDHVFSDLVRNDGGNAVMSVWGSRQRLDVEIGPNFHAVVVYAPKRPPQVSGDATVRGDFVCLEPMTGITNCMNLAHRRVYDDLQYSPPGGRWEEAFRIKPSSF
jgi:aldose 1-epimerase